MPPSAEGLTAQDAYTPDRLFAGEFPRADRKVTILSGQNITRGALLGRISASGKYILSLAGASDGSEVPDAILAEDVDASGGDKDGLIYQTGAFNEAAVTFGADGTGSHDADNTRQGLRDKSIFLRKTQPAAA